MNHNDKKIEFKWEKIGDRAYRAKVIGGWIVKCVDASWRNNPVQVSCGDFGRDLINESEGDVAEPEVVTLETATTKQIQTCADLEGAICKESQVCQGPTTFASGVVCCTGECIEKPKSNNWIWGIILLAILGGILYWYYYKSKKEGKPINPKGELEVRTNKFQERTHPRPEPPKEVRRSLSRQ